MTCIILFILELDEKLNSFHRYCRVLKTCLFLYESNLKKNIMQKRNTESLVCKGKKTKNLVET